MNTADLPLRALTIHQPWAACIAATAGKDVENRLWPTRYRGPLAIHSGRTLDEFALNTTATMVFHDLESVQRTYAAAPPHLRTLGAIIALAELTDCHPADGCCTPWGEVDPDVYHWVLTDIRALSEPIPCRGRQRLWIPEPVTLAALAATPLAQAAEAGA